MRRGATRRWGNRALRYCQETFFSEASRCSNSSNTRSLLSFPSFIICPPNSLRHRGLRTSSTISYMGTTYGIRMSLPVVLRPSRSLCA